MAGLSPGSVTDNPHPVGPGLAAGRRFGARVAARPAGGLTSPSNATAPTLGRVKADAGGGCDVASLAAPCFDVGNTFAASTPATWTGSTFNVTGGLAANADRLSSATPFRALAATRTLLSPAFPSRQFRTHERALVRSGRPLPSPRVGQSEALVRARSRSGAKARRDGSNCIDMVFRRAQRVGRLQRRGRWRPVVRTT